jgi:hypothetical protein
MKKKPVFRTATTCTHHHFGLRGCMLERGHEGPHHNPNGPQIGFSVWKDEDGMFVCTQEDWGTLVDMLGRTRH